tara:strand:+ start:1378 stop:3129 length:1752 start_codon:yes stop_codon:yes gene_type:complete
MKNKMAIILKGDPVSKGISIGKCYIIEKGQPIIEKKFIKKEKLSKEVNRFKKAVQITLNEFIILKKNVGRSISKNVSQLLETQIQLSQDTIFLDSIIKNIKTRLFTAEWSIYNEFQNLEKSFDKIDDIYIKQRIDDIKHVVHTILNNLSKKVSQIKNNSKYFKNRIIIANDLTPSDVLLTHESKGLGLISEFGGQSSHSSILTRSLEIPTVVNIKDIQKIINNDDQIIIDGNEGIVIINPDGDALKYYKSLQIESLKKKKQLTKVLNKKNVTKNNKKIELMVNLELPQELKIINKISTDGVGLFRTEYLYTEREDLPSEQEQFLAYKKIVQKIKNKPVIFRTLDIGSDKEVPENIKKGSIARNPALGLRGIRHSLNDEIIFINQVKAIMRAGYFGKIKILLPMITNVSEVYTAFNLIEKAKQILRKEKKKFIKNFETGIMIEVPSSAVLANRFAKYVDFFSIGTNDLVQYTLAIDRIDEEVNYLYDPLNSAVLSLIKMTIDAGKKNNIPVALCGEMAGDVKCIKLLLGMGLRSFSMHPSALPEIKNIILETNTAKIEKITNKIMNCDDLVQKNKLLDYLNNNF